MPTAVPPAAAPWRFGPTTRQRVLALIRYGVFALIVGAGGAVLQRKAEGGMFTGLLLGIALGLFLFRGQLRQALAPTLALGRESAFLITGHRAEAAPWSRIESVSVDRGALEIVHLDPTGVSRRWTLPEELLALPGPALAAILSARIKDQAGRVSLPTDDDLRRRLRVTDVK